jgi:hypothetical protein
MRQKLVKDGLTPEEADQVLLKSDNLQSGEISNLAQNSLKDTEMIESVQQSNQNDLKKTNELIKRAEIEARNIAKKEGLSTEDAQALMEEHRRKAKEAADKGR